MDVMFRNKVIELNSHYCACGY